MNALRGMAVKVTAENISAADVSQEYTDLSAKLRNLENTTDQLNEIMKKAVSVTDVLSVQTQITQTEGDIEQTKARIKYLAETSAMSLITINLQQSSLVINLIAGIEYAYTKDNIGFKVDITSGISPYTYTWDFGDGITSTDAEPWHKYSKAGDYNVTVTVIDAKGHKAKVSASEHITKFPVWEAGSTFNIAWQGLLTFLKFIYTLVVWLLLFSPVIIVGVFGWKYFQRKTKSKKAVDVASK